MDSASGKVRLPVGHWIYSLVAFGAGLAAWWRGAWMINNNIGATDVIVTVFSILAGFLIAVMTFLGDQSTLPGGWKQAAAQKARLKAKLTRQKWLFALYLSTLGLIFIAALLREHMPATVAMLERIYFGLATTTFILSLRLPWTLMSIQQDRLDAVVSARKASASTLERN